MKQNSNNEPEERQQVEVFDSALMVVIGILMILMMDWLDVNRCTC